MKRSWVGTIMFALLIGGPLPIFGLMPNDAGNGGDVVLCRDASGGISSAKLLDFHEADVLTPHLKYELGGTDKNHHEKIQFAMERLRRLDPERADRYARKASEFDENRRFVQGVELPDIPDSGYVPIPKNCEIKQIAIRKKPLSPDHKLYTVNKDYWDLIDGDHKAGLVLHEIIYGELHDNGQKNSVKARYFTALVSSKYIDELSQEEYNKRLKIVLEENPISGDDVKFVSDTFSYVVKATHCEEVALQSLLQSQITGDLDWSIIGAKPKFVELGSETLKLCPERNDVGHHGFSLAVKDGDKGALALIEVLVVAENLPPLWTQDPIRFEAVANQAFSADLSAYVRDPDGDALVFQLAGSAPWMVIGMSGVVSGTPSTADVGENTFTVTVSDGQMTSTANVIISVKADVPPPPFWVQNPINLPDACVGQLYRENVSQFAQSPDGNLLSFAMMNGPNWAFFTADGMIAGRPSEADLGANRFTVRVEDPQGSFADADVIINVVDCGTGSR